MAKKKGAGRKRRKMIKTNNFQNLLVTSSELKVKSIIAEILKYVSYGKRAFPLAKIMLQV